jgi:hypothetical protein
MFWKIVFRIGYALEVSGRYLVVRANSRAFKPLRGLGFPDCEARTIAHKVVNDDFAVYREKIQIQNNAAKGLVR